MPILPIANNAAVAAAPNQTSLHAIWTSGRILKIAANRIIVRENEKPKSTSGQTDAVNGSIVWKYLLTFASTVLSASDTTSRKHIATTSKKDKARVRRMSRKNWRGFGATSQIVFIAS